MVYKSGEGDSKTRFSKLHPDQSDLTALVLACRSRLLGNHAFFPCDISTSCARKCIVLLASGGALFADHFSFSAGSMEERLPTRSFKSSAKVVRIHPRYNIISLAQALCVRYWDYRILFSSVV